MQDVARVFIRSQAGPALHRPTRLRGRKSNMELVGYNDLQGRSAYQPLVHKQGNRFIAYVGHHGGSALNPLTGKWRPTARRSSTSPIRSSRNTSRTFPATPPGGRSGRRADGARVRRQRSARARTRARSTCCAASGRRPTKSGTSPIRRSRAASPSSSAGCATRTRAGGNATRASPTSSPATRTGARSA